MEFSDFCGQFNRFAFFLLSPICSLISLFLLTFRAVCLFVMDSNWDKQVIPGLFLKNFKIENLTFLNLDFHFYDFLILPRSLMEHHKQW
jgi:hypothetical protein